MIIHSHNKNQVNISNHSEKIEKASEMQQPSCKSKSFGLALQISKKLKNSFGRESPKEHLGKVWLKLTKWFQRCVILKITSGRGWG